jgi:hypothetical protein
VEKEKSMKNLLLKRGLLTMMYRPNMLMGTDNIPINYGYKVFWEFWPDGKYELLSPFDFEQAKLFCNRFSIPLVEADEDDNG